MMKLFAWCAFILAIVAGTGLAADATTMVLIVFTIGLLVKAVVDIAKDKTPNQDAIVGALVMPTLLVYIPGPISDWIQSRFSDLWDFVGEQVGYGLATTSTMTIAAVCLVVAHTINERAVKASNKRR
jgi:hypothetical protein